MKIARIDNLVKILRIGGFIVIGLFLISNVAYSQSKVRVTISPEFVSIEEKIKEIAKVDKRGKLQ